MTPKGPRLANHNKTNKNEALRGPHASGRGTRRNSSVARLRRTKENNNYPPLTANDILILRGKPMAKKIVPASSVKAKNGEEWVYYSSAANREEYYFFENGYLVGWKKSKKITRI